MNTYIYAVCEDGYNHLRTINGSSMLDAKERIIDLFRNEYEIDEEFSNWAEFLEYMYKYFDVIISQSIQDTEAI